MPRYLLPAVAAALIAIVALFSVWPGLDLAAARLFYLGEGRFAGRTALGDFARTIGYAVPFLLLAPPLLIWLARRAGLRTGWRVTGRAAAFLALTMALGPGLIVNLVLKDNSHRPRPVQITEFGGKLEFRPVYRFDGACGRNCSLVSGETSAAFWTLAPALLMPQPIRAASVAAAMVFGVAVGALRMAYGGHFLSDTVLAALLTLLVIGGVWRCLFGTGAGERIVKVSQAV